VSEDIKRNVEEMKREQARREKLDEEINSFIKELDESYQDWEKNATVKVVGGKIDVVLGEVAQEDILLPESVRDVFLSKAEKMFASKMAKTIPTTQKRPEFQWLDYTDVGKIYPKRGLGILMGQLSKFPSSSLPRKLVEFKQFMYREFNDNAPGVIGVFYNDRMARLRELRKYEPIPRLDFPDAKLVNEKMEEASLDFLKTREDFIWKKVTKGLELVNFGGYAFHEAAERLVERSKAHFPVDLHVGLKFLKGKKLDFLNVTYNPWVGQDRFLMFSNDPESILIFEKPLIVKMSDRETRFSWELIPVITRPGNVIYGSIDPDEIRDKYFWDELNETI